MTFETINEPVEVISYFDVKNMRPLRFRWRDRAYKISHVNGVWSNPVGQTKEYHFHVATQHSGSFELIYDSQTLHWKIGRVCVDE